MNILIVGEGSNGHESQSWGLAHAIADQVPSEIGFSRFMLSARGWLRRLMTAYLKTGQSIPRGLLNKVYSDFSFPKEKPDLLICSGGKSVFAAVSISRRLKVPVIFCGDPTPFPVDWFFGILSPVRLRHSHPRLILTEGVVSPMSPDSVRGAWQAKYGKLPEYDGKIIAVLIGGASRSNPYTDSDWLTLANQLNHIAEAGAYKYLLTTSRRTGADVELQLKQAIDPDCLLKSVWWSLDGPEKAMMAFLDVAKVAVVTQDSVSMLCESSAAGCPVVALKPSMDRLTGFSHEVLVGLADRHAILPCLPSDLSQDVLDRAVERFVPPRTAAHYANQTISWLQEFN